MTPVEAGDVVRDYELVDIHGNMVSVPQPGRIGTCSFAGSLGVRSAICVSQRVSLMLTHIALGMFGGLIEKSTLQVLISPT
jgi:hypothetical protein